MRDVFRETKTKRIYIRMTASDHAWLFDFARQRQTNVTALFEQFIVFLKDKAQESKDADPDHTV